jgi:hypothetical protein
MTDDPVSAAPTPLGFTGSDRRLAANLSTKADDMAVVGIVLTQMNLLEARLGTKIDSVIGMTTERWRIHEDEHKAFGAALGDVVKRLDSHLHEEEVDDLVYNARMGVVKRAWAVAAREWRTITILGFLILDFGTVVIHAVQSLFIHP